MKYKLYYLSVIIVLFFQSYETTANTHDDRTKTTANTTDSLREKEPTKGWVSEEEVSIEQPTMSERIRTKKTTAEHKRGCSGALRADNVDELDTP